MMWIWLAVGMLIKSIHLSILNFKSSDLYTIPLAVLVGLYLAAESYDSSLANSLIGLPLGFSFVIAFAFKDRLLPVVTEGTLFGYALIAAYLYFSTAYVNGFTSNIFSLLLVLGVLSLSIVLLLYPYKVNKTMQTLLMCVFISLSIYIGYMIAKSTIVFTGSNWELVLIGYSYLALVANVYYLLYFIPIPSQQQTLRQRFDKILEHASHLEEKYVTVSSTSTQILLTALLFIFMVFLSYFKYVSDPLLIAVMLTFMVFVHTPREKSKFMPAKIKERL